jgi:NAD-dependent dihydropyrimidine dehydrogenase PreA subunit
MTAYPVNAEQCHECGLCVSVCPEDAITLVPQPEH